MSSCHIIEKHYERSVPIGKPISNSTCYILDKNQNLLPIRVPGEICVGGDGVAIGYLNNERLTAEKFIPNKFGEGRLYRTGDLGYWEDDGIIQFVSRIDNQVKIRGFRIELKEIETKILEFEGIKECAVIVAENNSTKILVACIVAKNQLNIESLNTYLKSILPFYMVPSKYLVFDSLPLNINGKLDTKKLLSQISYTPESIIPPKNKTEEELVKIWEEILEIDTVGTNQNFFELGGDSLLAIKLISLINLKFNIQITIKTLFDIPTIHELASHIINKTTSDIFDEEKKNDNDSIYDYSKINDLLNKNDLSNFYKPLSDKIGNLLLFGATGFLGSHILSSFLDNEGGIVYCIVRNKEGINPQERLIKRLNFYFKNKYDKLFGNRIKVLSGDITQEKFGLSNNDYSLLGQKIDTVINSAAIVKHYGKKDIFENINVTGTSNIIDFCKKFNKKLLHCSTLSLTRDLTKQKAKKENIKVFSEKDFYFGQNLNNLYISTKFKAEELIYKARLDGLKASCLRIGNISNRYSDGMFQKNIEENAILSKLKSFIEIGYIPDYLLNLTFDFTQVDMCSYAILKIANTNIPYSTFHIINNNTIQMKTLIEIFKKLSINIEVVSEEKFMEIFNTIRHDKKRIDILLGIIQDWIRDKEFKYYYDIDFNSDFTNKYLESIGFIWPNVDINYFKKYINYLRSIGYLGG